MINRASNQDPFEFFAKYGNVSSRPELLKNIKPEDWQLQNAQDWAIQNGQDPKLVEEMAQLVKEYFND